MEANDQPEPPQIHDCHRREKGEPTDNVIPVPMIILGAICALFFWAGIYMTYYAGNFDSFTFDENIRGTTVAEPPAPPEPLPILGAKIYKRNCAQCHQPDGKGVAGTYPPLQGSPWVTGPYQRIAKLVLSGMSGPIEVLGNTYNGNMPAHKDLLKDRQIAAVLTYVRTKAEWGHSASEVTEEEIAALRAEVGNRGPWSPDELLKLYP